MIRETECFSINSDMSSRISGSTLSKSSSESTFTSSVFPTPVGPTKMKDAGRFLAESRMRLRRTAAATAFTASSCPMMRFFRPVSRSATFCSSLSFTLLAGIPLHSSMTLARWSSVTGELKAASCRASIRSSSRAISLFSSAMRW